MSNRWGLPTAQTMQRHAGSCFVPAHVQPPLEILTSAPDLVPLGPSPLLADAPPKVEIKVARNARKTRA